MLQESILKEYCNVKKVKCERNCYLLKKRRYIMFWEESIKRENIYQILEEAKYQMKKDAQGEEYISAFPKFKKWINECVCCHTKGYDPAMPDQIKPDSSLGGYFIKKYFDPLILNSEGLCSQCEKMFERIKKSDENDKK